MIAYKAGIVVLKERLMIPAFFYLKEGCCSSFRDYSPQKCGECGVYSPQEIKTP
jgi:hypothetical protein